MFDHVSEGRWWDRAWTLVEGCTRCSPGCERCWLMAMDRRFGRGRGKGGGPLKFWEGRLDLPLKARKPAAWAVWSDLFHPEVTSQQIAETLDVMASWRHACRKKDCDDDECCEDPGHVFLVLTKRATRMKRAIEDALEWAGRYMQGDCALTTHYSVTDKPLPNLWLGVTVCNQAEADAKIPLLLQVPAAVRFLSIEPMLGPVDIAEWLPGKCENDPKSCARDNCRCDVPCPEYRRGGVDWVILGGETGPGARPLHPDWVRSVRDQCVAAGVKFFFKGWGEWGEVPTCCYTYIPPKHGGQFLRTESGGLIAWPELRDGAARKVSLIRRIGRKRAGRALDGRTWEELPERKEAGK